MTSKEKNTKRCKSIAKTFEAYAYGNMYTCPHCAAQFEDDREYGEEVDADGHSLFKVDSTHDESGAMCCPECGEWVQFEDYTAEDYAEQLSLYDYIADAYDFEVTRGGLSADSPIRGVRVCVAFGGPNIYIDTNECAVKLYWWADCAEYAIDRDACDALDELVEQLAA